MKRYASSNSYDLYQGDMLDMLDSIQPNSIDSIVTDPPYELNFMGKGWDSAGISFRKDTWQRCFDVLKPGGYLLAFGGTRTYHRIACAIEDAGFEIRDCIMWLYGSGLTKSMNIGAIVNKKTGGGNEWDGWGTALKPAYEPIIVARKTFDGPLADNVIKNNVGGLNIGECRVPSGGDTGRFPSNVIHDGSDEVCLNMPDSKGGSGKGFRKEDYSVGDGVTTFGRGDFKPYNDNGSASRYFYCARASKRDRNDGVEGRNIHPTVKPTSLMQYIIRLVTPKGSTVLDPFMGSGSTGKAVMYENIERKAGYKFIGIELTEEYLPIAEARIKFAQSNGGLEGML